MSGDAHSFWSRLRAKAAALAGWTLIVVLSLALYDALLFASLDSEHRAAQLASATVAADSAAFELSAGIRLGKSVQTWQGLQDFADRAARTGGRHLAILTVGGRVVCSTGNIARNVWRGGPHRPLAGGRSIIEAADHRVVFTPVLDRWNQTHAHVAVLMTEAEIDAQRNSVLLVQLGRQLGAVVAGIVLLALLFGLKKPAGARSLGLTKADRFACLGVFALLMCAVGASAVMQFSEGYTQNMENDARRTGARLEHTIERLTAAGVRLNAPARLGAYLDDVAHAHRGTIALEVIDARGRRIAAGSRYDEPHVGELAQFVLENRRQAPDARAAGEPRLRIAVLRAPWLEHLRLMTLDLATTVVVAMILMTELFLLLTRSAYLFRGRGARVSGPDAADRALLLRPLAFFMLVAVDMSVSFIPLQMGVLVEAGAGAREFLLGLPVSVELATSALTVLVAGFWVKRWGATVLLVAAALVCGSGTLLCVVAADPWLYIVGRALAGAGYGLFILVTQAETVGVGKLADLFAGVYAGGLCGSALGAMLADRIGFLPVYFIAAVVMLAVAPFPWLMARHHKQSAAQGAGQMPGQMAESRAEQSAAPGQEQTAAQQPQAPAGADAGGGTLGWPTVRVLLTDARFLSFTVLVILPGAFITGGWLYYLSPVFLEDAGASQSDIGRVYMINCLLVIYFGPWLEAWVHRRHAPISWVAAAGLLTAASMACVPVLAPLPAAFLASIVLGVGNGLSIGANSSYLLEIDSVKRFGTAPAMGLWEGLQNVGRTAGPVVIGLMLGVMDFAQTFWALAAMTAGATVLFVLTARIGRGAAGSL